MQCGSVEAGQKEVVKAGNRLSKMLDFQNKNLFIYCKKTLAALYCNIIISRNVCGLINFG
ncbi:zinc ribbon domain-containing protein [Cytobacillus praedii]|uniref:zinc ribbon domain-containing protein n=1 Tax=Cytobacillus praedii TaxID=1742358 RepID=UPI0038BBE878